MKLFYGNGSCTIEGSNAKAVLIRYKGAIEIDDKTSDSFAITAQKDGIVVFPLGKGSLNNLFDYIGEFKILSVKVSDGSGEKVPVTIHRVMDYTELLNTNAEDMTTNSEDLSSTHVSVRKVPKTVLKQPYIPNRNTSTYKSMLYLEDGTQYEGYYHIHLSDNACMTGKEHTEDSQDLYFSTGKPTKNPSLIPYRSVEKNRLMKSQMIKSERRVRHRSKR